MKTDTHLGPDRIDLMVDATMRELVFACDGGRDMTRLVNVLMPRFIEVLAHEQGNQYVIEMLSHYLAHLIRETSNYPDH